MDYYTPYNHHDHDDHYFHKDAPYIEPDYYASFANKNMPILSTVARGPRGFGMNAEIIKDEYGLFIYRIYNDETGETVFQSPNLHPGMLTVDQGTHTPVPGEVAHATISVRQGNQTTSYDLFLPPGTEGSRIFVNPDDVKKSRTDVYTWPEVKLTYDSNPNWPSKPKPRVNDYVFFKCTDGDLVYLAVGHIRAVEANQVTATVQTYIPIPAPYIGDNGNWWVGPEDTGVRAQGPKGDKGTYSAPSVEEVGAHEPVEVIDLDPDPTNAQLHFKIPMAKMILIQDTVDLISDLPEFDTTPLGYGYLVREPEDLRYDLYYRGPGPDWIVVEDWQGKPASVVTGDTFHLPWGEDASVIGTPTSGNEVKLDFYIPDILPETIPYDHLPIEDIEENLIDPLDQKKADKDEVEEALATKADKDETEAALDTKADKDETEAALDGKVDKAGEPSIVYGTSDQGTDILIPYEAEAPVPGTVPVRTPKGNLVGNTDNDDPPDTLVNKEYLNQAVPKAATATPSTAGNTASVGTSFKYAREDHVHRIIADEQSITIRAGVITALTIDASDIDSIVGE